MNLQLLPIEDVKPYENNPRVNDHAVDVIAQSIQDYEFNQPLIVDENYVIIAGHTRWLALKSLGHTEAWCVVSELDEEKAKQYRIADNKTAELAKWDPGKLTAELREFENRAYYFSEEELKRLLDDELRDVVEHGKITSEQIEYHRERMETHFENQNRAARERLIEVVCEHCNEEFAVDRDNALRSHQLDVTADAHRNLTAESKKKREAQNDEIAGTEDGEVE